MFESFSYQDYSLPGETCYYWTSITTEETVLDGYLDLISKSKTKYKYRKTIEEAPVKMVILKSQNVSGIAFFSVKPLSNRTHD